jgi:ubiquinone/menaquinone biosynthesis C-methylase UbiE
MKKLRRIAPRTQKVVQATLTQLPFRSGAFETLICSQVIEHVPEPLVDWCEMNRVLTTGGIFVVGTPDYATVAWPALERAYGIVHPKGYVHEHINQYTAASLRHALESHGFEVVASAYVGRAELIIKARKVAPCTAGH